MYMEWAQSWTIKPSDAFLEWLKNGKHMLRWLNNPDGKIH